MTIQSQDKTKQVYKVTTEGDIEGKTTATLGYATGNLEDIKRFFEKSKTYSLSIEPIKVVHVTPDLITRVEEKKREYRELKKELEGLEKEVDAWYGGD